MLPTVVTYHVERREDEAPLGVLDPILEQVRLADRLGFVGAWFAEHHFGGHRSVMPAPLLLATHVAAQTERLRVGTSIICLPLHNPVAVAEEIAVADLLSGGRMDIGFGSGSAPADFAAFGTDQASRHERFGEALEIVQRCWSGEPFSYDGSTYHLENIRSVPTPCQSAGQMVWLAASSEPTAELAGRLGFGLQLPRGRPAGAYVPIIAAYRERWRQAGHPVGQERVSIARCLYVGLSETEALETVEAATRRFAQRWQPNLAQTLPTRDLLERMAFCVGDADTVRRHLQELRETTGLTHLSMQPTWDNLPPTAALASLRRYQEVNATL